MRQEALAAAGTICDLSDEEAKEAKSKAVYEGCWRASHSDWRPPGPSSGPWPMPCLLGLMHRLHLILRAAWI